MDLKVALQDFETECKKIDNLVIMPNLSQRDVFNLLQPIIHQYLEVFSQNIPSTNSNGGINDLIIKDSDTIKDINNIDNKD